ncbi:hypothetical protein CRI93_03090 [Longimonas halophila]|uniref:Twin-arginine translocation signal domain-containing protein n=1 Tax=Longimonas halophila TaxID=1469170 RepID=A0A2H3NP12_9BACT|nr:transglutaminase domain-containing protein [Longimonas halophila]PEN08756.1 hypothetical protein CRI93_03090 [Longimonas halophila]
MPDESTPDEPTPDKSLAEALLALLDGTIDRRAFLKRSAGLAGGAALAATLPGCIPGCEGESAQESPNIEGALPYAVWEQMQQALRTSPDHLPAQADRLVEAGDPEAIFRFVRDRIATYPPPTSYWGTNDLVNGVRWGTRATLRGGAGTPREKADLLADLYQRAGLEAEVVTSPETSAASERENAFYHPVENPFAPEIDPETVTYWRTELGLPETAAKDAVPRIDEDGQESAALAERLLDVLPEDAQAADAFDARWQEAVGVRLHDENGPARYANPSRPNTSLGTPPVENDQLTPADAANDPLAVEVTLEAAVSSAPEERFELVSGQWTADEVAGRQLLVRMAPTMELRELLEARLNDVRVFAPLLAMQAPDLSKEEAAELSERGDAVTIAGDRLEAHDDGTLTYNGRALQGPGDGADPASVETIEMQATADRFPQVTLQVRPLDADGEVVSGLPASAFAVEDEGEAVGFTLSANRDAPIVRILADQSTSMPEPFQGASMEQLVDTVREQVLAQNPDADVRFKETNSDQWTALKNAARSDANLIVYAHDGEPTDGLNDEIRRLLDSGPPAVILDVTDRLDTLRADGAENPFDEMAEATGGTAFPVSGGEREAAREVILDYLDDFEVTDPYRLDYRAPTESTGERTVRLRLNDGGTTESTASYTAEAVEPPVQLSSLHLTVKVGDTEVTRTLAGWDEQSESGPTDTDLRAVRGALFGTHLLSFEAAAPSTAIVADDFLAAKITHKPVELAVRDGAGLQRIKTKLRQGTRFLPSEPLLLHAPLPTPANGSARTYETGLRAVLFSTHFTFGEDYVSSRADVLPTAGFATAAPDRRVAFRRTLRQTARLAVTEQTLFSETTRSRLAGRPLRTLNTYTPYYYDADNMPDAQKVPWRRAARNAWTQRDQYFLGPEDGEGPPAFWSVTQDTGALLGLLADGSGGGSRRERIEESIDALSQTFALLNLYVGGAVSSGAINPIGGVALGAVALHGQVLARMYGGAAMAVALMDASQLDRYARRAVLFAACEASKMLILGSFSGGFRVVERAAEAVGDMDDMLGATGAPNPFSCPG